MYTFREFWEANIGGNVPNIDIQDCDYKYPFIGDFVRNLLTRKIYLVNAIEYSIDGTRYFLLSDGKTYRDLELSLTWQIYKQQPKKKKR